VFPNLPPSDYENRSPASFSEKKGSHLADPESAKCMELSILVASLGKLRRPHLADL